MGQARAAFQDRQDGRNQDDGGMGDRGQVNIVVIQGMTGDPTEQELCDRHGLGRHTVREALRLLEEVGLLSRQAGAGTVVLAARPREVYSYRIDSIDNLTEYARVTVFDKKQEGVVSPLGKLADTLGIIPGGGGTQTGT
jgi:predicted transcriptional regulator